MTGIRHLDDDRLDYRQVGGHRNAIVKESWIFNEPPRVVDVLLVEAAPAVVGRKLDETALAGLDQAARRACKPIDDKRGTIEYRTKVAGVLARRAATIAYERAGRRR